MRTKREYYASGRRQVESAYQKVAENYAFLNGFDLVQEGNIVYKIEKQNQESNLVEFIHGGNFSIWFATWTKLRLEDETGFDFYTNL